MLRGGALEESYHVHQLGTMSEDPPLSPTATSSLEVRTMPFLMTSRCAESSAPTSGTSSPFSFIPGDGFLSPALDSKHDIGEVPITSFNKFLPSSREEILSEDASMLGSQAAAAQQLLYGPGSSFQSGGAEANNTHSSGTSAGSSQLSNGERHGTASAVQGKDGFGYSQLHTATSAAHDNRSTANGSEGPSNDRVEEWGGNQQAPLILTEQSMVQQRVPTAGPQNLGRNENSIQEPGSQLKSGRNLREEVQKSKSNKQPLEHVDSSSGSGRVYPDEIVTQSNASEIFPAYSTSLMSSDPYNFPTGAELLALPTQLQSSSRPSRGSVPNAAQHEGGPFGNVGALYSSQSIGGRLGYSGPSLKGNWGSVATQYANSSLLDGNVQSNLQVMSPLVGTPVSSLLSTGSLQDNYNHGETQNRDGTSYFSSSQTQPEAMQLRLNPNFGGEESTPPQGNLVLLSNTGVDQPNMHGSHNQQHFLNIPLPQAVFAQSALAHRSNLLAHEGIAAGGTGPNNIGGNQEYSNWRNGGNELLFLPGSESTVHTQPFSGQLSTQLQQAELAMSQYGSRRSPTLSSDTQVHQHSFFQHGDGSSPAGIGNYQNLHGLSLSLSSQQPPSLQNLHPNHGSSTEPDVEAFTGLMSQDSAEAKGKRVECNEGRYNNTGILSRFRPQRDDHDLAISAAAQRVHNYGHPADGNKHHLLVNSSTDPFQASGTSASYECKYLKLSQILLNEICVVKKCEKRTANHDHLRPQRSSWNTDQPSCASASNTLANFQAARDVMGAESARKDFTINAATLSGSTSSVIGESRGREPVFETHIQENRDQLEKKKLRLRTYLEEVDRRYRAYGEHMMDVNNQFNSVAGPEAATPYTALALQAMSRHFRCLRDAVSSQFRAVKRALGEQDTSPGYSGRDLSSLRFVDQQLRQQRALQQLGMLQQHAWRPQRGLPERAVSVLRSWLFEHFLHPYPKDSDKLFLAKQTGLTRSQVSNWFINARVRLWKPMVEEMYLEEFSNSDEGGSAERNSARERRRENEATDYDNVNNGSSNFSNGHGDMGADKQQRITIASGRDGLFPLSNFRSAHGSTQNDSGANSLDFDADQRGGILKKARNDIHNSDHLASPIVSLEIDSNSPQGHFQDPYSRQDGSYASSADQDPYSQHPDILTASTGGRFGAYLGGGLAGYPGTSFVPRATGSTNGGVSLTLGLRHSDGLSLSGAAASQQKYSNYDHGHQNSQRSKDHFDTGIQDDTLRNMDSVHSELPLSHLNPGQDGLKQRNRISTHLLHEFVAQG